MQEDEDDVNDDVQMPERGHYLTTNGRGCLVKFMTGLCSKS